VGCTRVKYAFTVDISKNALALFWVGSYGTIEYNIPLPMGDKAKE